MTILFAVDLTEPTEVVHTVEQLADRLDAQLMVLHVDAPVQQLTESTVEPLYDAGSANPYALFDPSTQEQITQAREHAFYRYVSEHFSVPIRPALREGPPAETIIEDAHENDVDMIVVGKRKHPALERLLVGSVSQKVVERTDIPTLLVPIAAVDASSSDGGNDR